MTTSVASCVCVCAYRSIKTQPEAAMRWIDPHALRERKDLIEAARALIAFAPVAAVMLAPITLIVIAVLCFPQAHADDLSNS